MSYSAFGVEHVEKSFKSGVSLANNSRKAARLEASAKALGVKPDKKLVYLARKLAKKKKSLSTRLGEKVGSRLGDSTGSFLNPW